MALLFGELKTNLAKFAGDGAGDDVGRAREVNQAVSRLMATEQWSSLSTKMRMLITDTVFPLPANVESLLGATIDGRPAQVYGSEYQFIANGPGDLDRWTTKPIGLNLCSPNGLADDGFDHATMFDIPLDGDFYQLVAFSTSPADVGSILRVQGFGKNNEDLRCELPINTWADGVEGNLAGSMGMQIKVSPDTLRSVGRVILPPAAKGYISLYAVQTANSGDVPPTYLTFSSVQGNAFIPPYTYAAGPGVPPFTSMLTSPAIRGWYYPMGVEPSLWGTSYLYPVVIQDAASTRWVLGFFSGGTWFTTSYGPRGSLVPSGIFTANELGNPVVPNVNISPRLAAGMPNLLLASPSIDTSSLVRGTGTLRFLGKYHPSIRVPQFHRYRFTSDLDFDAGYATVLARVKLKFIPFVDDYDVVPLDSDQAIRNMMLSIRAEESGNLQQALQYEAAAKKILGEYQYSREQGRGMPIMIGSNPATMLSRGLNKFSYPYYSGRDRR